MANSTFSVPLEINKSDLWLFIINRGEWAQLIPGYLHHEFLQNDDMIWVFKGDFGFIEKAVKVQLTNSEVLENERLSFTLKGLSDNINGDGYFSIVQNDGSQLELVGYLNLSAGGFLAGMINPVLEKYVPETTTKLVEKMAEVINQTLV